MTFSVRMGTWGIAIQFKQHGLQIALSLATYIILSSMTVFVASVQRTNFGIMSLLTSNTTGGMTTYIEHSAMPTPREPMPNSRPAMFSGDSMWIDIFLLLRVTSQSPTSSIQCSSASLTTSRSGFSTSWRHMNGSTNSMQYGYPRLLTTTSHQILSQMWKFLNRMGRRWRWWAGTCLEL